jgi:hypothetical protein
MVKGWPSKGRHGLAFSTGDSRQCGFSRGAPDMRDVFKLQFLRIDMDVNASTSLQWHRNVEGLFAFA